jgi:ATP-binding cassette, subfamily B, bacterial
MSDAYYEEEDFTSHLNAHTFRRILGLILPHWNYGGMFLLAITLVSILDAVFTFLSKRIIDEGILGRNPHALISILTTYGILVIVQACGVFTFIYIIGILGEKIRFDLRKNMFNHLQALSLSYFSRTPVGWIMARVSSDSDRVADLLTWGLLDTTWAAINIVTSTIFMLIIDWRLALIVLAILPVILYVAIEFRKRILLQYRNVRKLNSRITGSYNENITGVRVIKALVREDENIREFGQLTGEMYRSAYRAAWLSALFLPTVQFISAFAIGGIAWFGGYQSKLGWITIGGIQAFISYVTFMMWPIQDIARVFAEIQHAIASAERIFSLVDTVPEIVDRSDVQDPGSMRGNIEFEAVNFSYENDSPVLKDFSLKITQGETIALVGPTGGGKSTIINLLCRFYEPNSGIIRICGKDYTNYSLHAIQSRIGIVPQTPHLFSGTIRENISYGRLNASLEEVQQAATLVGAHEFIIAFKNGYDEQVGEGGNLLSVGQKQLISLARAILTNPDIFIMDEATSSVDTLTESMIQHGMEKILGGRTSLIIAHRLSTIKRANRIVVIENGQITEMGTHAELLKKNGKYYHLYTNQFRHQMEQTIENLLK